MHNVYSLFLFISASVVVYSKIFVCIYFFSFDATILVNKDAYIVHQRDNESEAPEVRCAISQV